MRKFVAALGVSLVMVAGRVAADEPAAPTDAEAQAKVDGLRTAMTGTDVAAKKKAIDALSACVHPACVHELHLILGGDNDELKKPAAEALGKMKGIPDSAKALLADIAPNDKRPSVVVAILKSLAALGDPQAVALVRTDADAWFCSTDTGLQGPLEAAMDMFGAIRCKASMEALVALQAKVGGGPGQPANVRKAAGLRLIAAVEKLTGQKAPKGDLTKWWKQIAVQYGDDMAPVAAAAKTVRK